MIVDKDAFDRPGFETWFYKRVGGATAEQLMKARSGNRYRFPGNRALEREANSKWSEWVSKQMNKLAPPPAPAQPQVKTTDDGWPIL